MAGRVFRHTHRHAQKELKRLCTRLGLPPITLHGFRHLHASLLLTRGMPIPEVSQRLGHAHPGITMGVYAHVLGQSYKAVQIMEDLLK
jgi:integrase